MFSGLTSTEAAKRLQTYGKNTIPRPKYRFLKLVFRQFKGIFNLLLIGAALVTWLLGEFIDAGFIFFFVLLSVGLSLFQEHKSNAAADTLRSYLVRTIMVRRDGKDVEVSTEDIVVGDILKLESGDIVPADAVVRHALGLQVDETTFTGESVPVIKIAIEAGDPKLENILPQGVVIVRGTAYCEVTATGVKTRLAQIAKSASETENVSELTKGIDRISTFILRATIITLVFVVGGNMLIEGSEADILHLVIFAIALAVSVIPEALPLVMTFSLSRSAITLAKQEVIVKRLSSVQDLGSIELLCTDKTGTITNNHLVYKNDYIINESKFHPLFLSKLASNDIDKRQPEPFDRATNEALSEVQRSEAATFTLVEEEAFDPALRSNGAIVERGGTSYHIRRGSPEYFFAQGVVKKEAFRSWIECEERLGHRILGVSYDEGAGAVFGGFISFADELKDSTLATIAAAQELNVHITIITGDSRLVAEAVGRETKLVSHDYEVMEAADFFCLSLHEQHELAPRIRVFARTTPEQKLEIIELLKETHIVGFLGEGINDAPALKAANVSMVVQSASDVARETADIILLRPDLGVIIEGIKLGRETQANTLKYVRATLVSNFGNFYAVAIASLFISFLPMLPKQLLLLNLLSDFPMMAIALDRVSKAEVAVPQKYDFKNLYIIFITLGLVSTLFDFLYFGLFYRISPEVLQTNWFVASVVTEILLIISIRSMLPIEKAGRPAGIIIALSIIALLLAILITTLPPTAQFFEFTTPTLGHLAIIGGLALTYLIVTEMVKRPLVRVLQKRQYI
jgi:P-type Mg2+ transporter